jgi:hypothetical protein
MKMLLGMRSLTCGRPDTTMLTGLRCRPIRNEEAQ